MMYNNKLVCSVKVNGKILREKILDGNSVVSIPFSSEYSLIFKNLSGRNAVIHTEIDGKDINAAKQGFYLQAGKTMEIEGFEKDYKTERKFKFIQKTSETSDFRGDKIDDGMVRVTYQFEREIQEIVKKTIVYEHIEHIHEHHHILGCHCFRCQPYWYYYYPPHYINTIIPTYENPHITYGNVSSAEINNTLKSKISLETKNNIQNCSNESYSSEPKINLIKNSENLLDGITVEGSKSNQSFGYASTRELEENVHSMIILLKGYKEDKTCVIKPVTVDTKKQCPSCGRHYKSNFEYCMKDGTALKEE